MFSGCEKLSKTSGIKGIFCACWIVKEKHVKLQFYEWAKERKDEIQEEKRSGERNGVLDKEGRGKRDVRRMKGTYPRAWGS